MNDWCWLNPEPEPIRLTDTESFSDVWLARNGDLVAVSDEGTRLQRRNGTWLLDHAAERGFGRVAGVGPNFIVTAWQAGTVQQYDGELWGDLPKRPVPPHVADVASWHATPSVLWAHGSDAIYLATGQYLQRFDGTAWHREQLDHRQRISALWGSSPSDIWAGALTDGLFHYDGARWTRQEVPFTPAALWGRGKNDVYAVGETTASFKLPPPLQGRGRRQGVWHFDGNDWRELEGLFEKPEFKEHLRGVSGSATGRELWVRSYHSVYRYDGQKWTVSLTAKNIRAIAANTAEVVVAGPDRKLLSKQLSDAR